MREEFHGPAPGCLLAAVEFAQIEDVALKDAPANDAAVFDNAPVRMLLTILAAFLTAQKHGWITSLLDRVAQGVGRHYKHFWGSTLVKSRVPALYGAENR